MTARPQAVLWDLDGTLLRSMEQHWQGFVRIFAPLGLTIDFAEVCELEGKRSGQVIEILAARKGRPLAHEEAMRLGDEKQRVFRSLGVPGPYPGAFETLRAIDEAGIPQALITGTSRENVRHMLGKDADLFRFIVTGEEVTKTKPDPEGYLRAARTLGVPADACVVVENAPLGVQSGKAAGARVVAVTHTLPAEVLRGAGADVTAADLAGVARAILGGSS